MILPLVKHSPRTYLLLTLIVIALIAVACGGGDETPDETATPTPTAEAVTATATQAPTEAPPTATEAADAGGSVDENYLRAFCVGGNDLQAAMFTAAIQLETEGGDPDDPEVFAELFVEPLAAFLEHMRGVTPPDDLAEYHVAALAQYEALVTLFATIGEGGEELEGDPFELFGGMLAGAEQVPVVPQAALARLAEVAEGVPECAGSLFLGELLLAGGSGSGQPMDNTTTSTPPDAADEAYVGELCLAGQRYEEAIQQATAGMDPDADLDQSDPEVFATTFTEALRGLAADLREIPSPDRVAEYHNGSIARYEEMVAVLDGILTTLDAGDEVSAETVTRFQQLLQGGVGMPGLPLDEANRLAQAANNLIECYGSGFLLGFLGGGR